MPKKQKISTVKRKADEVFSKWVRLSAADDEGYFRCYTCGRPVYWKEGDASHFIDRRHMATRYDPRNVKPACRSCNRFHEGNKDEFALRLTKDHGSNVLKDLNQAKWEATKMGIPEIQAIHDEYKQKLAEL